MRLDQGPLARTRRSAGARFSNLAKTVRYGVTFTLPAQLTSGTATSGRTKLTSPRSFRQGYSRDEALQIMQRDAVKMFDPNLFGVFTDMMKRGGFDA